MIGDEVKRQLAKYRPVWCDGTQEIIDKLNTYTPMYVRDNLQSVARDVLLHLPVFRRTIPDVRERRLWITSVIQLAIDKMQ